MKAHHIAQVRFVYFSDGADMPDPMLTPILATLDTTVQGFSRTHCGATWAGAVPEYQTDPFHRLYWVRAGEAWTEHHHQRYLLRRGALYLIPAQVPARYHCPQTMVLDWIHCQAHVLFSVDLFAFLRVPYAIPIDDITWMDRQWEECLHRPDTTGSPIARDGFLRQLLALFIDQAEESTHEHLRGMARFQDVLGHIEAHLGEHCSLASLAEVANLHPTYFSTLFTQTMGEGPIAYVNRRRIERAKRLLRDTACTLQDIATAVGFCDAYYFTRCFKRQTQLTPGQFRRLSHERHP
jgi:AraC-like DNA-binding protein